MELSRYVKIFPSSDRPGTALIYSTLRGSAITVSTSLVEAMRNGTVSQPTLQTLERLGIMVPDAAAEREQVAGLIDQANRSGRRFTALVTLNLDCNLACPYCYEDPFRGKKYMSDATADAVVQTILNAPYAAGKDVILDFYGGEALLSVPLIRRISEPLRERISSRGNHYAFNLVTNGTLLNRRQAEELLPLGLQAAKITLDGPPDIHNRQRPFAGGNGSFASIVSNIKEVCDLLAIQVGGNYTRENYRTFPELLDLLLAEGITPDKLAYVTFTPVTPNAAAGPSRDSGMGCACTDEPWLVEANLHLRGEILKRGFKTTRPKVSWCMVESQNDLVIAYDGGLFKCPAFMGWPEMQMGSVTEGIADYRESHDIAAWKNEECLDCPYLPLCFGGCRFLQRLQTGSIKGVECRRSFLDATLEEMVRQDLALRPAKTAAAPDTRSPA